MQAVADAPNRKKLSNSCVEVLVGLFVWGRDDAASAVIDAIVDDPVAHLEEVSHLVHSFRDIDPRGSRSRRGPPAKLALPCCASRREQRLNSGAEWNRKVTLIVSQRIGIPRNK